MKLHKPLDEAVYDKAGNEVPQVNTIDNQISDEEFSNASKRFPFQTPMNKEEYYYRSIFEGHFPSKTASETVPSVPSVACSSPIAIEWDNSFKNLNDPSGRSIQNVHNDSY